MSAAVNKMPSKNGVPSGNGDFFSASEVIMSIFPDDMTYRNYVRLTLR